MPQLDVLHNTHEQTCSQDSLWETSLATMWCCCKVCAALNQQQSVLLPLGLELSVHAHLLWLLGLNLTLLQAGKSWSDAASAVQHSVECLGDSCMDWLPAEWADVSPVKCMHALRSTQPLRALKAVGHVATRCQHDAARGSQADQTLLLRAQPVSWHSSKRGRHAAAGGACLCLCMPGPWLRPGLPKLKPRTGGR